MRQIVANAQSHGQQGDRPSFSGEGEANATISYVSSSEKCHGKGIGGGSKYHGMFFPPLLEGKTLEQNEHLVFNYMVDGVAINVIAARLKISINGAVLLRQSVLEKCGAEDAVELLRKLLVIERNKVATAQGRTAIAIVGEVG